jgi:hypothetical protein
MDKEVIMVLLNKLPSWFIMSGLFLYVICKMRNQNINIIIRLIAKHNARKDRLDRRQNEKIERILEDLEGIRADR